MKKRNTQRKRLHQVSLFSLEADALNPKSFMLRLVGMTRLERATPWSQTKYTTNCTTSRFSAVTSHFQAFCSQKQCKGTTFLSFRQRKSFFFSVFRKKKGHGQKESAPFGTLSFIYVIVLTSYFRVTIARRLRLNGSTSATPPTPETVMLARETPRLTSSSATACARASDSFWL